MLVYYFMYVCMYVTMYACMHLCMCGCVGVWEFVCMYIHTYLYKLNIYIICFVHMGYFVMLLGGGGYCSFCI